MDKSSCDNLLNAILEQNKQEDIKQSIMQKERQMQRSKLAFNNNQKI